VSHWYVRILWEAFAAGAASLTGGVAFDVGIVTLALNMRSKDAARK
jgi:hypothetical protein